MCYPSYLGPVYSRQAGASIRHLQGVPKVETHELLSLPATIPGCHQLRVGEADVIISVDQ